MTQQLRKDLRKSKKSLFVALQANLQKELTIAHLQGALEKYGADVPPADLGEFNLFSNYFEAKELAVLRSMDNSLPSDTSFVRHCLKYLYKNNLDVLLIRTIYGTEKKTFRRKNGICVELSSTEPLTPIKHLVVKSIFAERISAMKLGAFEKEKRENSVNCLISKSIANIRKIDLKSTKKCNKQK